LEILKKKKELTKKKRCLPDTGNRRKKEKTKKKESGVSQTPAIDENERRAVSHRHLQ